MKNKNNSIILILGLMLFLANGDNYAVAPLLGAIAYNFSSLMIFRAVNGAFGSGIFPVTLALVGELFDDENRATALAKVMGLGFLGSAAATLIGGTLTFFGSWRLVYFVYGFFELVLAIVMLKALKKDQGRVNKLEIIKSYSVALKIHD